MSVAPAALDKATLGLHPLDQYEPLIGAATAERIFKKADRVRGAHVIHVNSTFYGGGVTEILTPLTLMMNAIGIETGWRQIQGTPAFFNCTKKLHNTLQGERVDLSEAEKAVYEQVVFENATRLHLAGCDAVIVHDPQPLPLVAHFDERKMPWLWQCHIDLSTPHPAVWNYLRGFVDQYDAAIFSLPEYAPGSRDRAALHHAGDQSVFGQERRVVRARNRRMPVAPQDSDRSAAGDADLALRPLEGPDGRHRGLPQGARAGRLHAGPARQHRRATIPKATSSSKPSGIRSTSASSCSPSTIRFW